MDARSEALQQRLGHRFEREELLARALTHRSFGAEHNERLEFLGDAVLNLAVSRLLFERQKEIEYSITAISGKDLVITKENDKVVIGFAYDKEVPIYGPVFILIKYEGRSR